MPVSLAVYLPLYETEPICNLSNVDISYSLVSALPEWITFDATSRTLTAESDDLDLIG